MNQHLFGDCESNVLSLKSSFLSWAVVYVPNFSSSNLVDLVTFLYCRSLWGDCLSCILCVQGLCIFLSIKLLFIKEKRRKSPPSIHEVNLSRYLSTPASLIGLYKLYQPLVLVHYCFGKIYEVTKG